MIRWEALAVVGLGVLVGLAIAAATLVPFSLAVANLPWQALAVILAGAAVLGPAASELPARHALRRDPIEMLGAQEWPRNGLARIRLRLHKARPDEWPGFRQPG
jgi:hypothetical protein